MSSDAPHDRSVVIARFLTLAAPGRDVVLTTHVHPDGDGLGSQLALSELLTQLGCRVRIVNADPPPRSLLHLPGASDIEHYDADHHDAAIESAHLVVMLDNSDPQRLGPMEAVVRRARGVRACIDHHPNPDPFWQLLLVRDTASCTGILVHELYRAARVAPSAGAAAALYAALVSDTGRFRFANTTAEAFRIAAELVDAGARPAQTFSQLDERVAEGFLRLFGETLNAMEVRARGRLVVLRVALEAVERYGAAGDDMADIINNALLLESSRLAVLFRELAPGRTKVSLRSKGPVDVNVLARRHGGGGHRNASGIVFELSLDDAAARLVPELEAIAEAGNGDA